MSCKQHGFVPQKSTVMQLVNRTSVWQWARNSKIATEIIYLDFSKAFDKCLMTSCSSNSGAMASLEMY